MPSRLAAVLAAACVAVPAGAVEVIPALETRSGWESNVFGSANDEESAVVLSAGPDLIVRERSQRLFYEARYQLRYEKYFGLGEDEDDFEHVGRLDGRWQLAPRTALSVDNAFFRVRSLSQLFQGGTVAGAPGQLVIERERVTQNSISLGLEHDLSPRNRLDLFASNFTNQYQSPDFSDALSTQAGAQLTRKLTPRTRVGIGAAGTRQDFDEAGFVEGRGSSFLQGYGLLAYQLTPTFGLSVSAGPAWVDPDSIDDRQLAPQYPTLGGAFLVRADTCPMLSDGTPFFDPQDPSRCQPAFVEPLGGGAPVAQPVNPGSIPVTEVRYEGGAPEVDPSVTVYGRAGLEKSWEKLLARLSYERSASASAGIGTSTNLDAVTGRLYWTPTRKWTVSLTGAWEHQVSASEVPENDLTLSPATVYLDAQGNVLPGSAGATYQVSGAGQARGVRTARLVDNAFEFTTWRAELLANRRITDNASVVAYGFWWHEEPEGDLTTGDNRTDFRIELGFRWEFDPIDL